MSPIPEGHLTAEITTGNPAGIPLYHHHKIKDQTKRERTKKQTGEQEICVQRFVIPNTPPQTVESPRAFAKCLAFTDGKALVSVSAVISSVEQYTSLMVPASIT